MIGKRVKFNYLDTTRPYWLQNEQNLTGTVIDRVEDKGTTFYLIDAGFYGTKTVRATAIEEVMSPALTEQQQRRQADYLAIAQCFEEEFGYTKTAALFRELASN